jgi:hypothetical protein
MIRLRKLTRSPTVWGILTFVPVFLLASVLANQLWKSKRSDSMVRVFESEIQEIRAELDKGRLPSLLPLKHGSETPQLMLLQMFFAGAAIPQIEGELSRFIEIQHGARASHRGVWEGWRRTLVDIRLDIPSARTDSGGSGRMLHLARWHIARAQGWLSAGNAERGLVDFLRAMSLCRQVLQLRRDHQHDVEASFIAAKALYYLFGRSGLLREVRKLGSSSIWSVRAERILAPQRRA